MPSNNAALMQALAQQQSLQALGQGHTQATGRFDKNYYDPTTTAFAGAPGLLAGSFGLGGDAGTQAAQAAFQAGPGYQFAQDQGIEALGRNAASRGMLGSGNQTQDILRFSQGLANQEYDKFRTGLGDLSRLGLAGAEGQTGRQGTLAGLDTGYAQAQAGVYDKTAGRLAELAKAPPRSSGLGSAIAGGLNLGTAVLGTPYGAVGGTVGSAAANKFFG